MVQIQYKGLENNVKNAVQNVNTLFQYAAFYDAIRRHRKFEMSNVPPSWIADLVQSCDITMSIEFYYSVNPFSHALSYDDPKNPAVIHLNKWNLNKPVGSICNALVHQCVHAVNAQYPQYIFGHGDNSNEGKENTAPLWIANLAQQIITQDDTAGEILCHETEINIPEIIQMPKMTIRREAMALNR